MTLLEITNWVQSRTAVLEYDNDSIHLYSHPHSKDQELKCLWVANTSKRMFKTGDIASDMKKGLQPYMPKKHCNKKAFIKDYENKDNWRLQWGLDQNSISVHYKDKLIAVMPEWSGHEGFWGYSIGVSDETDIAWPLNDGNEQIKRITSEQVFLDNWSDSDWVELQEGVMGKYKNSMRGDNRYFAGDGGNWPPLGIHYCKNAEQELISTIGMSILPMPLLGMNFENPEPYRKIELAIIFENARDGLPLASYISGQATYPWSFGTHFNHGHTIPCSQLEEAGSDMSFMLILETANFLPEISLNQPNTRLLFMLPIYESEQVYIEKNGSSDFLSLMEDHQKPLDLKRQPVV